MKLYDLEGSGNCYKIRLFLSLIGIEYTKVPVDLHAGENRTSEFLSMNPNGLIPVLVDGSETIYDSIAILSYLAKVYADESWFPGEPVQFSKVIRWLAFEQSEVRYGLARARVIALKNPSTLGSTGTLEESQVIGKLALNILNKKLSKSTWLADSRQATICDIACYPYTAMSNDGGVSVEPYPAVIRWIEDIERLDGYIALPGRIKT
ncbi:MAG: glutathione S-transferase family protein [Gammaproteobacteria bacterium]|nr:glutathione S-transferase family protein [Gammaproteobacteria bacterium]MDX2487353.1 glutathione S-transferase family protein [Gammaproteobacteria bacterium]